MPLLASGEMVGAIAMTEPDAGSDLQGIRTKAKREGENGDFILNGSKVSDHDNFYCLNMHHVA
jgi:acyl-CoA dehydrogenase